jgi:hypothetical protein
VINGLWEKLLNWAATKAGARLAPLFLTGIAFVVGFSAQHIPMIAPYATPGTCLFIAGTLLYFGLYALNYITTVRAFKYAKPVQAFIDSLGQGLGLPPLEHDGVIAGVTVAQANEIAKKLDIKVVPGGAFQPSAPIIKAEPIDPHA